MVQLLPPQLQRGLLLGALLANAAALVAQTAPFTISGTVVDEVGDPLIGVTLYVPSLNIGTATDIDGRYTLSGAADAGSYELQANYLGYLQERIAFELPSASAIALDIDMETDALRMDEVIVTGPSIAQSRRQLGNSITTLNAEKLQVSAPGSVFSALQGKVPGAQITQNSGDPAGGFSVRLRGASTINGSSDPLYVVDGVIISNATNNVTNTNVNGGAAQPGTNRLVDINPNDIETLTVINGAAAAAIYGSRASNGVVLITTKRGKSGAPRFSFSSAVNVNELRERVPINLRPEQFGSATQRLYPIAGTNAAGGLTVGMNLSTNKVPVTRYDYQDDIFRTGVGTDQYLSVSGGSEKSDYFASVGYLFNEGIIRNADFRRYNVRLRYNQRPADWLSFSVGLNYSNSFSNEKPDGNVFWSPINSINITNNIYDINERDALGNLQAAEPTRINPLSVIEDFDITQEVNRVITDVQVKVFPFAGMTIDYVGGVDAFAQLGNNYIPPYPYSGVNPGFFDDGYAASAASDNYQLNHDINARYETEIGAGSGFTSTTQAGATNQFSRNQFTIAEGRKLAPFVETVNGAGTILGARSNVSRLRIWGYYLQQTFGFRDRLFLTAAGRIDGASSFSPQNRDIFYPKVSASYVLSEEDFWKGSALGRAVPTARFRASWGKAGNLTGIGPYDRFATYGTNQFLGVNAINAGANLANPDVRPEIQTETEFGADFSLLDNRIGLGVTYYSQDIEDLLLDRVVAASAGGTSATTNVGSMTNKGLELTLNGDVVRNSRVTWNVYANFARNRNRVTDLGQPLVRIPTVSGAPIFLVDGEPIGVFFGSYQATNPDGTDLLTTDGLPQREQTGRNETTGQPTGGFERKVIGNPNPDYILGVGTQLTAGRFGVNAFLESVQGVDVFDADYRTRQGVGIGDLSEQELSGELPRGYINSIYPIEQWRIRDGSFVKLRELALTYTIPSLAGERLSNTVISVGGRNLFSIDNFTSFDPEVNAGGQSNLLRAVNFGQVPIPRTYTVSVRTNF